ncbi:hypothetical protein LN042_24125 [Kitasatospora sp. RB6PN24]|uniref:hypothetical protein n=1 Tax=Kitasatospora humi TaxID=2893891 RepID=UPI001E42F2E9|nr:hypothetical protein [Kitasatospora humi]MCC9310117.1 hypothetical protein [Kitasatospora humi]
MLETPEDEIRRLEGERHNHSATFANTSPEDTVTRAHLQREMDWRTNRIIELQSLRGHGFFARWTLRLLAAGAAWGAIEVPYLWAKIALGVLALFLAFYSLA